MKSLIKTIIVAHERLINDYGGSKGLRDTAGLEAAAFRPYATFDGVELYPTEIEKSAAILESLLINHPFVDGNKRIGYFMMEFILYIHGKELVLTEEEKYDFTIKVAEGKLNIDTITAWLNENVQSIKP